MKILNEYRIINVEGIFYPQFFGKSCWWNRVKWRFYYWHDIDFCMKVGYNTFNEALKNLNEWRDLDKQEQDNKNINEIIWYNGYLI